MSNKHERTARPRRRTLKALLETSAEDILAQGTCETQDDDSSEEQSPGKPRYTRRQDGNEASGPRDDKDE